jgi:hypothetical protein
MAFTGTLRPMDVLMDVTCSDDVPIQIVVSLGHSVD